MTSALRWGWVVSSTPRPLYPREGPGIHCTGGWVGSRAGLDGCGKSRPPPEFDPRSVQPVASRYTDLAMPAHRHNIYIYITSIKTATCFGTQVSSSGIYCDRGLRTNLLIYVSFIIMSLIKTLVVKVHKIYKHV